MHHDIMIIGAGPAGLAFARALAKANLNILLVDKSSPDMLRNPAPDGREIALTHLSVRTLKELGIWRRIPTTSIAPIKRARVLNGASRYSLDFDHPRLSADALGYIVPNHLIRRALYEEVSGFDNIEILTGVMVENVHTDRQLATVYLSNGQRRTASLLVAADSRFSMTRRMMGIPAAMQDFSRVAIVCRMTHEKFHEDTAFECFHYGRTLAVLPLPGIMSSVVITVPADQAREIETMDEDRFNADIQQRFDNRLGEMHLVGERHVYPLVAVHADRFSAQRFALIGDAAVGMHPVTAHGFNLGLRGSCTLASEILSALSQGRDFASREVLQRYQTQHMRVTKPMYLGTNGIVNLFTNDALPGKVVRNLVLRVANNFPPIKQMILGHLMEKERTGSFPLPLPGLNRLLR